LRPLSSVVLSALTLLFLADYSAAELTPTWSVQELSAFASLVVSGRVTDVSSQWDPAVNGLYTYATIEVDERWKGPRPTGSIVVKMLGGRVDDIEMRGDGP